MPILGFYCIFLPFMAFLKLKRAKNLDDWSIKKYYFILYQGYTHSTYYWEFVNLFTKMSILSINAFLNSLSINYRILICITIIYLVAKAQSSLKPYKLSENNFIECLGLFTICIALL